MHQMSLGGRAPTGSAGGAYSAPPDLLAALKLLAPRSSAPTAPRLTPVFGDQAFRFFFFPIRTLHGQLQQARMSTTLCCRSMLKRKESGLLRIDEIYEIYFAFLVLICAKQEMWDIVHISAISCSAHIKPQFWSWTLIIEFLGFCTLYFSVIERKTGGKKITN